MINDETKIACTACFDDSVLVSAIFDAYRSRYVSDAEEVENSIRKRAFGTTQEKLTTLPPIN